MASSKLQRYMSVLKAKGAQLDPLAMAKMLREDVAVGRPHGTPSSVAEPVENVREKRMQMVNPTQGDISGDPVGPPSLAEALHGKASRGYAKALVGKGIIGATTAAVTAPSTVSPVDAMAFGATKGMTGIVSLGLAFSGMFGSGISAEVAANDVAAAFGDEAAQEAASVMSGKVALSSVSPKAQNAYANAMVAMETSHKTIPAHIKGKLSAKKASFTPISTVTPHHTPEAISAALGGPDPSGFGADVFGASMEGLHGAIDAMNAASGYGSDSSGSDSSGGNVGGGGTPGVGPGPGNI